MAVVGIIALAVVGFMFMNSGSDASMQKGSTEQMTATVEETEEPMQDKTIVTVASEAENFKTLVAAVQAAGLVDTLNSDGPFTVFAPTDEAFAKLPAGTVEELLNDKEQLTKILTYHVVPGKVMASDVVNLDSATTVQGGQVAIKVENGVVMVNDATVKATDIEASNGVIHVIDTVLMPQ